MSAIPEASSSPSPVLHIQSRNFSLNRADSPCSARTPNRAQLGRPSPRLCTMLHHKTYTSTNTVIKQTASETETGVCLSSGSSFSKTYCMHYINMPTLKAETSLNCKNLLKWKQRSPLKTLILVIIDAPFMWWVAFSMYNKVCAIIFIAGSDLQLNAGVTLSGIQWVYLTVAVVKSSNPHLVSQLESNTSPPEGNILSKPQINLTAEIKHQGLETHDRGTWTLSDMWWAVKTLLKFVLFFLYNL